MHAHNIPVPKERTDSMGRTRPTSYAKPKRPTTPEELRCTHSIKRKWPSCARHATNGTPPDGYRPPTAGGIVPALYPDAR